MSDDYKNNENMHGFAKDTLVICEDGTKPIQNVSKNDIVLTHKNRWRKVSSISNALGDSIIISDGFACIQCGCRQPISCTDCPYEDSRESLRMIGHDWIPVDRNKPHVSKTVMKIMASDVNIPLYRLEVEDDNSYTANGIVVFAK